MSKSRLAARVCCALLIYRGASLAAERGAITLPRPLERALAANPFSLTRESSR